MFYMNQVIILQRGLPYCTFPEKVFLAPSVWARREYIWKLKLKESLLIYFQNFQGAQARNQEFFREGEVSENKGTSINI